MKFLLDANAVVALLRRNPSVMERLKSWQTSDFGMPSIVMHELFYGVFKSSRIEANRQTVDLLRFEVVPFDREDSLEAGRIRADLAQRGLRIGPYDVLIAGQAVARSLTLITRNIREFERIAGLKIENWEG